jgi:hypothetical protein
MNTLIPCEGLDLTELEEIVEGMYATIPKPHPPWMSTKEEYMAWLKERVLPDMERANGTYTQS